MIRAYIPYRKPYTGVAEAPCASLYPSTYPHYIVRAYDAYSIHIKHDTAGKLLLIIISN